MSIMEETTILTQHCKIPSADGLPLSATVVSNIQKPSDKVVLVISAMGVPRQFYSKYAYFYVSKGLRYCLLTIEAWEIQRPRSI